MATTSRSRPEQLNRDRATAIATAPTVAKPARWRHAVIDWGLNLLLLVGGLLMVVPFVWAFSTSLRLSRESFSLPPRWLPTDWQFSNYQQVLDALPFFQFVFNSFKVAGAITLIQLVTCSTAAFAFSRLRFRGRDPLFFVFLAALMIPQYVTIIPIFVILRQLNLLDSHWALILPSAFSAFGIFLLRQFFLTIPRDLEDAAKLDGAGHLRILWNVIVPLSAPALSALAIFIALAAWNEFFWPNIFLTSPEKMTLPVGLVMISGRFGSGSPVVILAALSMIVVPLLVLFAFAQRRITESVAMTGLRG